jgi:hypothetical protein
VWAIRSVRAPSIPYSANSATAARKIAARLSSGWPRVPKRGGFWRRARVEALRRCVNTVLSGLESVRELFLRTADFLMEIT